MKGTLDTLDIVNIGTKLGVDWSVIPKEEFIHGFNDELEHSNITGGDPVATAKIAIAHLQEDPHYYSKLKGALEAKAMKAMAVKFVDEEKGIIGGFGLPYGGPMPGNKDLEGEDFGPDTNFHLDWFPQRPILYHHGLDPDLKDNPIGVQTSIKAVDGGRWIEGQLNKSHAYWEDVKNLIKASKLFWSSHCPPHLKEVTKDGHILNWPVVEFTLTPTPANPYGTVETLKAIRDLESIGIAKEALKAIEEKEGAPKSPPKGYPQDKGKYADPTNFKYPIDDEAHVRAAVSYFNHEGQRTAGGYSEAEWAEIGGRIARAASSLFGTTYQYASGKVTKKEEAKAMTQKAVVTEPVAGAPAAGGTPVKEPDATTVCSHMKDGQCTRPAADGVCEHKAQDGSCTKASVCSFNTGGQCGNPKAGSTCGFMGSDGKCAKGAIKSIKDGPCPDMDDDGTCKRAGAKKCDFIGSDGKCTKCSKDFDLEAPEDSSVTIPVALPAEFVQLVIALHESLEDMIPGICDMGEDQEQIVPPVEPIVSQGTQTVNPTEAKAQPEDKIAPTQNPGVSQGMGPETHITSKSKAAAKSVVVRVAKKEAADLDQKIADAVKAAVTPLQEQIKKLSNQPVTEGPVRTQAKISGSKIDGVDDSNMKAVLADLIKDETDPALKQALSNKAAKLEMSDIIKAGMQPLRKQR